MTDPVILLGTQSNGETLPVQVDGFGRLVAEGLQGSEGPPGPEGPAGGTFPLPADPYEGALLGWLNGELAWIGSPPVPIPPGVFGPITVWDAQAGLLTVEGEIPAAVGSGVYVWQCNQDGTYFTEGWNTNQVWSDDVEVTVGTALSGRSPALMFNADTSYSASGVFGTSNGLGNQMVFTPKSQPTISGELSISANGGQDFTVVTTNGTFNGVSGGSTSSNTYANITCSGNLISITFTSTTSNNGANCAAIKIDGKILVDNDLSLNFRVGQVLDQNLVGVPSATVDFTIGKYLRVPEQRVAPWVLYGNDPTSLIDHLRSS